MSGFDTRKTGLRRLASMARFRKVGVLILDHQGRVDWVNQGFETISGYSLHEIRGKLPGEFLTAEETCREAIAGIAKAFAARGSFSGILANRRKDGATHWVEIEFQPLHGPDGEHVGFMEVQTDVSQLKFLNVSLQQRQKELASSQDRLKLAAQAARIGLWEWNIKTNTFWTNEGWWEALGFSAHQEPVDSDIADDKINREDMPRVLEVREAFLSGQTEMVDNVFRHLDGRGGWRWINSVGRAVTRDEDGRPTLVSGVYIDIHDRKIAADAVAHAASHDALTGLANRKEAQRLASDRFAGAGSAGDAGPGFCLILIDLDHFKTVNDTSGHAAGDDVLVEVARRLRLVAGEDDCVARLGGDEFAIITGLSVNCRERAENLAPRIQALFREPIVDSRSHPHRIGASIGIAVAPEHGRDFSALMLQADAALYEIKGAGRNAFRFFDQSIEERVSKRRIMENELRFALMKGEFALHFQTQVHIDTGEPVAAEALLRWHHPLYGDIPPADFIPLAEETGFIASIGTWVIEEACRTAVNWPVNIPVAVNVSVGQLGQSGLHEVVGRALEATGLPASRLEIEITESVLLSDDKRLREELIKLHDMGVRLALDDFGTGYASLAYLKKLPFSKIKIDRGFVADIAENRESAAIIAATVNLAQMLDLATAAEGVETATQATLLSAAGCRVAQGYLFSKPVAAGELSFLPPKVAVASAG